MKVAISSDSFAALLAAGALTQLEWLENCAATLGADGVVFDLAHFARVDSEYIAQLRKVAVDLGLVPLAVDAPHLLESQSAPAERSAAFEIAAGLGALFVLTRLPPPGDVPPATFVAAVAAGKAAARAAKLHNVTLLVGAVAGSLATTVAELRHYRKDVDSAWLRYMLPAGTDPGELAGRERELVTVVSPTVDLAAAAEVSQDARPWLLLAGDVNGERVAALRRAAAKKTLGIAGVS